MAALGLRARLVAAFVGIAALTTLVSALLTSLGLHHRFDAYLEQRTQDAAASSLVLAESSYADSGGWTDRGVDLLAHELVVTGYDFRLVADGRVLLDTTKLEEEGTDFRQVSSVPVRGPGGDEVATLQLYALGPRGNMPADNTLRAELDRAHLLAAVVAAIVAIVAGLVVAGRLSRPLQRLSMAARELGAGRPPSVVPASGSREVRELGESLSDLANSLSRQQRARRQLAQDLSHELRTPMMLLQSRIEGMQDGILPFDAEGLATLHTETLRLSRLIGQIERLAEAEAQPPAMHGETVALDQLARAAHAALAAAFEIRGLTLELDAPPTPAVADRDAVGQIITNLLSNALKYAPDDSTVHLSTSRDEAVAILRVRDAGSGIDDVEEGARLFQRFYRGPGAADMSSGVGLGLTIARGLAVAQGGDLRIEGTGPGTCFTLTLPAIATPLPGVRKKGVASAAASPLAQGVEERRSAE
ncbi:sensor histidine kinase [Miltoncostaea oceani]|jgi:two-component system, OmpR family, sensor histidine kinase BaeS|uniref:sensor histidine kinase n=1 Tax=Miltoncostaea oceani TaxID=2843216 RepID=UPI001C3E1BF7|nr:HAMP domain-containing sensor histidine kinase [Miltoncostaea oceani]